MHIEPGLVDGTKIGLSYLTAASAGAAALLSFKMTIKDTGLGALLARSALSTAAVFTFFEIMPHFPVGISEVHFIFGSTLFLILGMVPAAFGLVLGLLVQGLFFAPFDLPQYGMNLTTLLVPLLALSVLARRLIAPATAYVDLSYRQALALSTAYQGGIVSWVAFWVLYGQGLAAAPTILSFAAAYMSVVLVEPIVDLALLAVAKQTRGLATSSLVSPRLFA